MTLTAGQPDRPFGKTDRVAEGEAPAGAAAQLDFRFKVAMRRNPSMVRGIMTRTSGHENMASRFKREVSRPYGAIGFHRSRRGAFENIRRQDALARRE
jgi:hypothetical protein